MSKIYIVYKDETILQDIMFTLGYLQICNIKTNRKLCRIDIVGEITGSQLIGILGSFQHTITQSTEDYYQIWIYDLTYN